MKILELLRLDLIIVLILRRFGIQARCKSLLKLASGSPALITSLCRFLLAKSHWTSVTLL